MGSSENGRHWRAGVRSLAAAYVAVVSVSLMAMSAVLVTLPGGIAAGATVSAAVPPLSGQIVYVVDSSTPELGLVNTDGSGDHTIPISLQQTWAFGSPELSPDGALIAFETSNPSAPTAGSNPCESGEGITLIDSDGSDQRGLATPSGVLCAEDPAWAPNSSRIAFDAFDVSDLSSPGIWTEGIDGSDPSKIATGSEPTWSPDGTHIAYAENGTVFSVPSGGGTATRLTRLPKPAPGQGTSAYRPEWSPTGSEIAYIETTEPSLSQSVVLMRSNGSDARILMSGGPNDTVDDISWSPSGQLLVTLGLRTGPGVPSRATNRLVAVTGRVVSEIDLDGSSPRFAGVQGPVTSSPSVPATVGTAATPSGGGYWRVATDGGVFSYGNTQFYGSMGGQSLNAPVVGMAPTADGGGYWLVAADGGVFAFGDASFHGSMGGQPLNQPIVGIAADPITGGYWLVAADGGVFAFDAPFYGSTGNLVLNEPMVGIAPTADGGGYWLVAADGGVFAFGGAPYLGSTGNVRLNASVTSMAATPSGHGYWLVGADGGIFAFGDAPFAGSMGSTRVADPVVGLAPDVSTGGYWEVSSGGGVFGFDVSLT